MISNSAVLIVGAGASKPYGYPTALELRESLIKDLIPLLSKMGGNEKNISPRLLKLIEAFNKSSTSSIDLFLTRNKGFMELGKAAITFLLANYEIGSKFREEIVDRKYDWYFELYNTLTKSIINPEDISKFTQNHISIITFNYDRSLEHFIYESLVNSFRTKVKEINELMLSFNIVHVYGKLAPLPWENPEGIEYGNNVLKEYFFDFSKNIQIIYDERKTKPEETMELISNATNIFFLGFGYSEENLEAIGFDKLFLKPHQQIYGTAYHLTESEVRKNVKLLRSKNTHMDSNKFKLEDCDCRMLLRNYL